MRRGHRAERKKERGSPKALFSRSWAQRALQQARGHGKASTHKTLREGQHQGENAVVCMFCIEKQALELKNRKRSERERGRGREKQQRTRKEEPPSARHLRRCRQATRSMSSSLSGRGTGAAERRRCSSSLGCNNNEAAKTWGTLGGRRRRRRRRRRSGGIQTKQTEPRMQTNKPAVKGVHR